MTNETLNRGKTLENCLRILMRFANFLINRGAGLRNTDHAVLTPYHL